MFASQNVIPSHIQNGGRVQANSFIGAFFTSKTFYCLFYPCFGYYYLYLSLTEPFLCYKAYKDPQILKSEDSNRRLRMMKNNAGDQEAIVSQ